VNIGPGNGTAELGCAFIEVAVSVKSHLPPLNRVLDLTLENNMRSPSSLIVAAALGVCGFWLAPSSASAQAAGPSNALDWTFQSLEEFHDEVRAQAGWHKSHWQCQPAGPCVWVAGFWGPPPAAPPAGVYVNVRPFGSVGWSGYYPN
jgi:hypothetical protein